MSVPIVGRISSERIEQANEIIATVSPGSKVKLYKVYQPSRNWTPLRMLIDRSDNGMACIDVPIRINWGNGHLDTGKTEVPFGSTKNVLIAALCHWILYDEPWWKQERFYALSQKPCNLYGPETVALIDRYLFGNIALGVEVPADA